MTAEKHTILGGKVHVYRRLNSSVWQCSTYMDGKNHRVSTKEDGLSPAKDFAEDWYLELRGKKREGTLVDGKSFKETANKFLEEFCVLTEGERNADYVRGHKRRVRLHLNPFFGTKRLPEITSGLIQDYRVHRHKSGEKPPARSTLHQEIVVLRQVLKYAVRKGWLDHLPDMTLPYRGSSKVAHRAWFSPDDYKVLYTETRARIGRITNRRQREAAERLHDKVLFMG